MDYDPTPTMICTECWTVDKPQILPQKRLCEGMRRGSRKVKENLARFKFSGRMDRKSLDLARRTCLHGQHQHVG